MSDPNPPTASRLLEITEVPVAVKVLHTEADKDKPDYSENLKVSVKIDGVLNGSDRDEFLEIFHAKLLELIKQKDGTILTAYLENLRNQMIDAVPEALQAAIAEAASKGLSVEGLRVTRLEVDVRRGVDGVLGLLSEQDKDAPAHAVIARILALTPEAAAQGQSLISGKTVLTGSGNDVVDRSAVSLDDVAVERLDEDAAPRRSSVTIDYVTTSDDLSMNWDWVDVLLAIKRESHSEKVAGLSDDDLCQHVLDLVTADTKSHYHLLDRRIQVSISPSIEAAEPAVRNPCRIVPSGFDQG